MCAMEDARLSTCNAASIVRVAACVGAEMAARLQRASDDDIVIRRTSEWSEMVRIAQSEMHDVAVVDPQHVIGRMIRSPTVECVATMIRRLSTARLILYVRPDRFSLRVVVRCATESALADVLLFDIDDEIESLRCSLGRGSAPVAEAVMSEIGDSLGNLPVGTQRAVRRLFACPRSFLHVADLALACSSSRRTLDRHLRFASLPTAADLLRIARVSCAFDCLKESNRSVRQVAAMVGYRRYEALLDDCHQLSQYSPSQLRRSVDGSEFIGRISVFLRRGATARSDCAIFDHSTGGPP